MPLFESIGCYRLSLHASSKFKDQHQRHMIIMQAEANIDTHMQMLGRVHVPGRLSRQNTHTIRRHSGREAPGGSVGQENGQPEREHHGQRQERIHRRRFARLYERVRRPGCQRLMLDDPD